MIDSRSKRWTRKLSAMLLITSSTAALPRRPPRNGNMSIGPWIAQSTSSSISDSTSSNRRSLIARCNAREKRQRLCSVMISDFPALDLRSASGLASLAPWPECCTQYLKLQIVPFARNAIAIFALHKCGMLARILALAAVHRLLLQRDFGVTDRDHPEQERAAQSADRGAERHEGKVHQHAVIVFKAGGSEELHPAESGADPECRAAERANDQTQQHKHRDFHDVFQPVRMRPYGW